MRRRMAVDAVAEVAPANGALIPLNRCACGREASAEMFKMWGGKCKDCGRNFHNLQPDPDAPEPPKCATCDKRLTVTSSGLFYPCGHGPNVSRETLVGIPQENPRTQTPARNSIENVSPKRISLKEPEKLPDVEHRAIPETVSATWGEELLGPKQFHMYRVGPFSGTTNLRPGETRAQATKRLLDELTEIAEAERIRKRESFLKFSNEK